MRRFLAQDVSVDPAINIETFLVPGVVLVCFGSMAGSVRRPQSARSTSSAVSFNSSGVNVKNLLRVTRTRHDMIT
eukprot:767461-Hanusia_phi.AAC.7